MAPTVAAFHHHNNPFHSPGYSMSGATQIHASYAGWGASTPSSPGATSPPVQQHPWQPYPQQQPTLTPSAGALVLYNPQSLFGLYYNEHLHGPFATGMGVNPFTPGLSNQVTTLAKPVYATEDPLRHKFPAARSAHDPLSWISDELFGISDQRAKVSGERAPLRSGSTSGRH